MALEVLLNGIIVNVIKHCLFLLTLAWGVQALAPSSYAAEVYRGTVIDAETKAPIEGAVVVVIWYKKPLITMDGPQYFHKAVEAFTDADGKFSVDASPGMNWNPFRRVLNDPEIYPGITVFKPGYGPFPEVLRSSMSKETEEAIRKGKGPMTVFREGIRKGGAVVELPRLKTKEELIRSAGIPCCGIHLDDVTIRHIPNLLRLINTLRKSLGLGYIGPEEQRPHP